MTNRTNRGATDIDEIRRLIDESEERVFRFFRERSVSPTARVPFRKTTPKGADSPHVAENNRES